MQKHEYFEELCAAASTGHATPEELGELERHASQCDACQQTYADYLNLAAQQFAAAEQDPSLSLKEAQDCLDSDLFTRRFLDRAQREGIEFSRAVKQSEVRGDGNHAIVPIVARRPRRWRLALAIAAGIAAIAVTLPLGYFYGRGSIDRGSMDRGRPVVHGVGAAAGALSIAVTPLAGQDSRIAELTNANLKLQARIERLDADLNSVNAQITDANRAVQAKDTALQSASQDRQELASRRDALETLLASVQQDLVKSQAAMTSAQQEAARLREQSGDIQVAWAGASRKIQDLTAEVAEKSTALDHERQLLSVGHDVTDLMAARNLHIVDVVDTDPGGKTRPAFGRVFFTEGKSLIFYAYDLNEARMEKANYQYRVWAKKEGADKQTRSLGIFYSDDKAQKRWVFKCKDPKILSEIDSVFVTFEPAGSDPARPKGQNLMYAYLRGQPNHP